MGEGTVRVGADTFIRAAQPTRIEWANTLLAVGTSPSVMHALVFLRSPAPRGATVLSATLRGKARGTTWPGGRTLTAKPLAGGFSSGTHWNNKPGIRATHHSSVSPGALSNLQQFEFDVTNHIQSVANGATHYGWRIESTGTTLHMYSFEAGVSAWELEVEWSDAPSAPTTLHPSSGAVSVAKPVLTFDYTDVSGSTILAAVQVQVDAAADEVTPDFDSGEVAATEPELDLSATAYAGLADGATTQWRVRVKDGGGLWSGWSDWAAFSREDKPVLTINNPSAGVVWEPTPEILASITGGTVTAWQIVVAGAEKTAVIYDSGRKPGSGTDVEHTIPELNSSGRRILVDDSTYWLNVRVWDAVDREATPGDPLYVEEWVQFTVDDDLAETPPATLTVTQIGETPRLQIVFTRATAPDAWILLIDGKVVQRWENADLEIVGTTYTGYYDFASSYEQHTVEVKAVTNGLQSVPGPSALITTLVTGVWLVRANGDMVVCSGTNIDSLKQRDRRAVYKPLNSNVDVDVITQLEGVSGPFAGWLAEVDGQTLEESLAILHDIKDAPTEPVTLVAADLSIPIRLRDLTFLPSGDWVGERSEHRVEFELTQSSGVTYGIG